MTRTGAGRRPRIIAQSCIGPWGRTAEDLVGWLDGGACTRGETPAVPPVPGFIESRFSPLVYHCVKQALGGLDPVEVAGAAIVLGSMLGDTTTADVASQNLAAGGMRNPLLFYQSVPNSVLGYLSREFGMTGPLLCVAGLEDMGWQLLEAAELLLRHRDAPSVAVVGVELAANPRSARVLSLLGEGRVPTQATADVAVCLVLGQGGDCAAGAAVELAVSLPPDAGSRPPDPAVGPPAFANWLGMEPLVDVCAAAARLRRAG